MISRHRNYLKVAIRVILLVALARTTLAQSKDEKKTAFTRSKEAVDFALKNYPAVRCFSRTGDRGASRRQFGADELLTTS